MADLAIVPWPTHRRCVQMLGEVTGHVATTLPDHAGRDWPTLMLAVHHLVSGCPEFALRLDAEFKRLQRERA